MSGRRWAWVIAAAGAVVLAGSTSWAGEGQDTVLLKNGGRLRGTVFAEDPVQGVSIKLLDGTTRNVPPAEVARVEYGPPAGAPATAPAPAAGVAPAALPPAAPPPAAYPGASAPGAAYYGPSRPPNGDMGAPHARARRSTGLMVTGIVLSGLGASALGAGIALFVQSDGAATCTTSHWEPSYYGGYDYGSYAYDSEPCEDETMHDVGTGLIIGGGSALGLGLFMTVFGASKKGGAAAARAPAVPDVRVGLGTASMRWTF